MSKETQSRIMPAHYVGLRIRRAIETVELHFAEPDSSPFAVTIPLVQLGMLHREILRKLEKEPGLFDHGSKMGQS